jgi:hypothetical protein
MFARSIHRSPRLQLILEFNGIVLSI